MIKAIETNHLVKRYGDVTAVDGVSLSVNCGEVYAFLGLNGAGKTTTIRMLLGMLAPTTGEVRVLDTPVRVGRRGPWRSVGYLVERPAAYPELTVRENLEIVRRLRPGIEQRAIDRIMERLTLTAYADRRAETLSQGNAQRLGLAKALLHTPSLLILDEPANGLDPVGIVEIRNLLLELSQEQGVTVFMSSHILGEVARLAQRIGIIHNGRLLQELDMAELEDSRLRQVVVRTRDLDAGCASLRQAGYAATVLADKGITLQDRSAILHPDLIAAHLCQAGHPPTLLQVEEEDLEHYFLRLVGADGGKTDE